MADVDLLVPHPKNANKHTDRQIAMLAKIMNFQGWRHPIVVSKRSGFIVAGHGRLSAAKLNGWAEVPIDEQDFENEAAEYAFLISDNTIAELAETDLSMVNQDVLDLGPDFDLELLGIPDFVVEPAEKLEPQCDEDDVGGVPADPKTKPGDIYQLGRHRLMCGDSTNVQHVETLMAGEKADMVFTDPPYGIDVTKGRLEGLGYRPVANDHSTDAAKGAIQISLALGCVCVFWGGNYFTDCLPPSKSWIVWSKKTSIPAMSDAELAWTNFDCYVKEFEHRWDGPRKASEKGEKRCHPTQKPVALAEWTFKKFGNPKAVLDLFGGSGSTLIACEKTDRQCFMMELDPHYCDVIVARWEKYTGQKAELING